MNTLKTTIYCALIILAYFLLLWLKKKCLEDRNQKIFSILNMILNIFIFIAFLLGLAFATGFDFSTLNVNFVTLLEEQGYRLIWTILVVIIGSTLYNIIRVFVYNNKVRKFADEKRHQTMAKVTMSMTKYCIYIVCFIAILKIWGVDIMPALAGLGIAGLVVGLGAQKLITDFVSGVFIVFEHHFDVGDIIEVGDFKGEVIDIGLKTTKIRNWKGQVKIIANGELNNIINDSTHNTVFDLVITVAYKENLEEVMKILDVELAKRFAGREEVIIPPQTNGVQELGASGIGIRIVGTTRPESYYQLSRDIRLAVKEVCEQNQIEIPFNQIVVRQVEKND